MPIAIAILDLVLKQLSLRKPASCSEEKIPFRPTMTLATEALLIKLDLRETKLSDRAADYLAGMKRLVHQDLRGTKMSIGAIDRLKNILTDCTVLADH
ncbi:MAG TPA: hypothetical protein V6C81_04780 [Planktothrix sp.]